jgi:hypothetical protein
VVVVAVILTNKMLFELVVLIKGVDKALQIKSLAHIACNSAAAPPSDKNGS